MILALETATPGGSVALVSGGEVWAEVFLLPGPRASGSYISAVEALFAAAGAATGDVSAVAVSAGPGAFTGLRVGMSAAKGQRRMAVRRDGSASWAMRCRMVRRSRTPCGSKVLKSPGQSFSLPSPQKTIAGWLRCWSIMLRSMRLICLASLASACLYSV